MPTKIQIFAIRPTRYHPAIYLRNLGTFYFAGGVQNWNWTVPQNDDLWRDGYKTLFDPCPPGWRVPKDGTEDLSPWNAFTAENGPWNGVETHPAGGRLWSSPVIIGGAVWYSAPGFRNAGNYSKLGGLLGIGESGYNWSATARGTQGLYLGLSFHLLLPYSTTHRGHGLSVRCLRE